MALTLKAMTYFTTALRHGNIAKAADELHIAASAISAGIDQVEDAFSLTLVTRHRARGIQPTASGRRVARKLERLLEDYRAVMSEGADLRSALSGSLRMGYYAPMAPAFLPQIFAKCLGPETEVVLHLEACDNDAAQDGLLSGRYDAILFVSDEARPNIAFVPLIIAPPYYLLPAGHPLAQHEALRLHQIAAEPLIALNRPVIAEYYQKLFGLAGRETAVVAYADPTEMVRSLVASGLGCAILNMRPRLSQTYGGAEVVARPIVDALQPLTLSIGYDTTRPRRVVQHGVDACQAHFARASAADTIVPLA